MLQTALLLADLNMTCCPSASIITKVGSQLTGRNPQERTLGYAWSIMRETVTYSTILLPDFDS